MENLAKRVGAFMKEMWIDLFGGYMPHEKCKICGKQEMYVHDDENMYCSNISCLNAGNLVNLPMPPKEEPYKPMCGLEIL